MSNFKNCMHDGYFDIHKNDIELELMTVVLGGSYGK